MGKKLEIFCASPVLFSLDAIQKISFSTREVDILACLIGCRTAKKIASLLLLSPRTVENYIRNLTIKIECNSRDGIITFIEQSDQLGLLQDHYKQLRVQAEFEKSSKNIAKINISNALQGMVFYEEGHQPSLVSSFQSHLKMAGLGITSVKFESVPLNTLEELKTDFHLYVLSDATVKKLQDGQFINSIVPLATHSPKMALYVCFESQQATNSLRNSKDSVACQSIQEHNYYFLMCDILKAPISSPQFEILF